MEEGFRTLAVAQKGREAPYAVHFRSRRDKKGNLLSGCVDRVMLLKKFSGILDPRIQRRLLRDNALFVPNRSLPAYAGIQAVEDQFAIPLLGNRALLRTEEREEEKNYYWLLRKAGLPTPKKISNPKDINCLTVVKLRHKKKRLERGFFTASSPAEYKKKSEQLLRQNVISKEDLETSRIEEYVLGPVFNLDFFYSPLVGGTRGIELLGIDWRFESSLDGHVRLPAAQQLSLPETQANPEYVVVGHNAATLRESLLEEAFAMARKYVVTTQRLFSPGILGPFTLQTCVDQDMKFKIFDVAPRIGGGTNIHMWGGHPYGNALWRTRMSTGRRIALEVRRAVEQGRLNRLIT